MIKLIDILNEITVADIPGNTPEKRQEYAYKLFRDYKNTAYGAGNKAKWLAAHSEEDLQLVRMYSAWSRQYKDGGGKEGQPISFDQYITLNYNAQRDKASVPPLEREYMDLVHAYTTATKRGKLDQWKRETSKEDQQKVIDFKSYLNSIARGKYPKHYPFEKWLKKHKNTTT